MGANSKLFWEKARQGVLWLQHCQNCTRYVFYPRERCPYCLEESLQWQAVSGRGRVYTYTVVRTSALPEWDRKVPYIYAVIETEEGIKMAGNIVQCNWEELRIGLPVKMAAEEQQGHRQIVWLPEQ